MRKSVSQDPVKQQAEGHKKAYQAAREKAISEYGLCVCRESCPLEPVTLDLEGLWPMSEYIPPEQCTAYLLSLRQPPAHFILSAIQYKNIGEHVLHIVFYFVDENDPRFGLHYDMFIPEYDSFLPEILTHVKSIKDEGEKVHFIFQWFDELPHNFVVHRYQNKILINL